MVLEQIGGGRFCGRKVGFCEEKIKKRLSTVYSVHRRVLSILSEQVRPLLNTELYVRQNIIKRQTEVNASGHFHHAFN